jgi:hypothetical protein
MVECGLLDPWFFAIADQGLNGDFALPNSLYDHPVFRPFHRYMFTNDRKQPVKQCLMVSNIMRSTTNQYGEKTGEVERHIVMQFEDGTRFEFPENDPTPPVIPMPGKDWEVTPK